MKGKKWKFSPFQGVDIYRTRPQYAACIQRSCGTIGQSLSGHGSCGMVPTNALPVLAGDRLFEQVHTLVKKKKKKTRIYIHGLPSASEDFLNLLKPERNVAKGKPISTHTIAPTSSPVEDSADEPEVIVPSFDVASRLQLAHEEASLRLAALLEHPQMTVPSAPVRRASATPPSKNASPMSLYPTLVATLDYSTQLTPPMDPVELIVSQVPSRQKTTPKSRPRQPSLAALCSKTNTSRSNVKVGLSKRTNIYSLHNYLNK